MTKTLNRIEAAELTVSDKDLSVRTVNASDIENLQKAMAAGEASTAAAGAALPGATDLLDAGASVQDIQDRASGQGASGLGNKVTADNPTGSGLGGKSGIERLDAALGEGSSLGGRGSSNEVGGNGQSGPFGQPSDDGGKGVVDGIIAGQSGLMETSCEFVFGSNWAGDLCNWVTGSDGDTSDNSSGDQSGGGQSKGGQAGGGQVTNPPTNATPEKEPVKRSVDQEQYDKGCQEAKDGDYKHTGNRDKFEGYNDCKDKKEKEAETADNESMPVGPEGDHNGGAPVKDLKPKDPGNSQPAPDDYGYRPEFDESDIEDVGPLILTDPDATFRYTPSLDGYDPLTANGGLINPGYEPVETGGSMPMPTTPSTYATDFDANAAMEGDFMMG